ncbi:MaoC family dehydratase [Geodermatophilus sp. SYSU D00815]
MSARTEAGRPALDALADRWEGALGTTFATAEHRVEEPRVRAYADLFGHRAAWFRSGDAARAAGFRGLVAPAGYATVYTMEAVLVALHSPELGVPFAWNLHAGQSLEFGEPVCAGDVLTTTVTLREVRRRPPNLFYAFATETRNGDGQRTVSGTSTQVVRFP